MRHISTFHDAGYLEEDHHWLKHVPVLILVKVKVKVKVEFTLEQATKAQMGSRGVALLFL